ncbi:helix-turn-helix transcriptional regulator [Microvirga arsenatis]|uniref:HTH domain-containing protein n=1 Tax=Microvirga arsenatis TaxID=2692265 RepID=A0ABW9Z507_9HYPH|nr:YafY family protein [Microvirga arsenatis]NBJ13006.1 HTH domain-containing protein [Microvirga arsenatis]NBJ26770.1 HTH domain-containing protein [Microvirga arsenatis]
MARTERLLSLLQILRRHRHPVAGQLLADELGISIRTLYRDIAALQALGATIEGEPGVGYVLRPGFLLPPLMFSQAELEALILGMRWVSSFADRSLAVAATDALAKIEDVLPPQARDGMGAVPLRVGPPGPAASLTEDLTSLRDAIRRERKLEVRYRGKDGHESRRVIWPFAIGYFTSGRILVGWCELRQDYRHFRTDRLVGTRTLADRYPRRRTTMLREWLKHQSASSPPN